MEKLLEDALIKRSVVLSDAIGVSGRAMLAALGPDHPNTATRPSPFPPRVQGGSLRLASR